MMKDSAVSVGDILPNYADISGMETFALTCTLVAHAKFLC